MCVFIDSVRIKFSMIEKGTIRKMGQYYRSNPQYEKDILRGLREFFGKKNVVDNDNPLFNEWMMYDFKFSDGRCMLDKFYNENPLGIPLYRREIYNSLRENYYGLFQVLEVRPFAGLVIKRLDDGKIFEVSEMTATIDTEVDDVAVFRVARVKERYELVGSNTQLIKLSASSDIEQRKLYLKEVFPKVKMKTSKDAFIFFKKYLEA